VDTGQLQTACGSLGAFINEVDAQAGKIIHHDQADELITTATAIRQLLDCRANKRSARRRQAPRPLMPCTHSSPSLVYRSTRVAGSAAFFELHQPAMAKARVLRTRSRRPRQLRRSKPRSHTRRSDISPELRRDRTEMEAAIRSVGLVTKLLLATQFAPQSSQAEQSETEQR